VRDTKNTTPRPVPAEPCQSELNALAVAKAYHSLYLTLTGNHFSVEGRDKTCFDHIRDKVIIGVEQLKELGINSQAELNFIILHELGHLKELRDDPDGYLSVIQACKSDPDGEAIFKLYNALMDIYVNRNAANKAAVFAGAQGEFSDLVKELYLKKAFPEHDLSSSPLSQQYSHYPLLEGMGVSRAYTFSEKIQGIINAGLQFGGRPYTYEEFIKSFLVPVVGKRKQHDWKASISERDALIKACILPIFKQLLEDDKQAQQQLQSGCSIPDAAQSGSEQSKPVTRELTLEEVEKLIERLKEIEKYEKMSSEEKAAQDLHRQAVQIAEAVQAEDPQDFADRRVRVEPIVQELVEELLAIRLPLTEQKRVLRSYSTEGVLHVPESIRKFGKVQRDPRHAEVMRRERTIPVTEKAPVNLRICLLPDLSGSMRNCIDGLRDDVVALAAAVATLCDIHKWKKSGIASELAIYGYDHTLHEILDPIPNASLKEVAASYQRIDALGQTHEYLALEHLHGVLGRLAVREKKDPHAKRTINIAISLTDGVTQSPERSIEAKNALVKEGTECFGVFLKTSGENPQTFDQIWGDRGYKIDSVAELPGVIAKIKARIMTKKRV
jgi:hypothetical protein